MSVFTSILIFIAVLLVIVITHEMGHFFASKAAGVKVLEFAIGFPPRLFSIKRGETQYSLNLIPLGAFVRTAGESDPSVPGSLASKSPWVRMGVYFAGPLTNLLIAFILFITYFVVPVQAIVGSELGYEIGSVTSGSPAEEAGIKTGDIILEIDGIEIHRRDDLHQAIDNSTGEITLLIQRDGEPTTTNLTPVDGIIGITSGPASPYITESERLSLWDATYNSGRIIYESPALLKDAIVENPSEAVRGPVGAGDIAVEYFEDGANNILLLAALISLGIGLFNLFPVPPLDGGGMVIAGIEGIRRGKRLSPRAIQFVYMAGAALLITFFIMITFNDISRLTTN